MILTCTSCLTRYFAEDDAIGPAGRSVRCAACGHTWFAEPALTLQPGETVPADPAAPPPLTREGVERMRKAASGPGPAPSAAALYRAQQGERMREERARAAIFAWTGAGAAVAASAAGAVVFRQDVAEFWPRSASAYAAFGFDVNVYGLEVEGLTVERAFEGPTPVLLVSGEVRNIGRDDKPAPPLRITLRDSQENELYEVVHALEARVIEAGGALPFMVRLDNPPVDAVDLEAAFASYREAGDAPMASPAARPAPVVDPDGEPLELSADSVVPDAAVAPAGAAGGLRLGTTSDPEGHG
ncbi:MAG: DUF3426 domain-containing protein [Alphaproteobacteria bacterium]|nr:DUF3426 domain-containing protein [Alphaproteobacteria bacterium]